MNAFQIVRYINRRLKACKVPHDAKSCDANARVLMMAEQALTSNINGHRTHELTFYHVGNIWAAGLKTI